MEIWTRAANFDVRKGKPLGWIICMARRRAIDHYRKIRRRADASEKLRAGKRRGRPGKHSRRGKPGAGQFAVAAKNAACRRCRSA